MINSRAMKIKAEIIFKKMKYKLYRSLILYQKKDKSKKSTNSLQINLWRDAKKCN